MKKLITMVAMLAVTGLAFGSTRVVEETPGTNSVLSISITQPSLLKSIYCTVSAASETNSYTITYITETDGLTNTLAAAQADVIQGEAFPGAVAYFNYDADSSTGLTEWLKAGDTLLLTSNDASNTAYSNITYRVVLEEDRSR